MIISLIGFMGAGKTTAGREIAKRLGAGFIDTDAYIEEREGKSIPDIFASEGESGFRKKEEDCLEEILEKHVSANPDTLEDRTHCTLVLSLGGGIIMTKGCRELISRFTYCIYLKTDIDTVFSRLAGNTGDRPLLEGVDASSLRETIVRLYAEREKFYEELADKVIGPENA